MSNNHWNRRDFVRIGMFGGAVVAGTTAGSAGEAAEAKVRYRTLGRTKLKVSEIAFGSFMFTVSGVLDAALSEGINFISTSGLPYQNGAAEKAIGVVLKKRRKDAVVMTGCDVRKETTKEQILKELDGSLERLGTDHVEVFRAHNLHTVEQAQNPAIFEAFETARAAKKAQFLGVSTHGGEMEKILNYAADSGKFDVLVFKYNFMEPDLGEKAMKTAAEKNLGVAVFKVDAGKREKELEEFTGKGLDLSRARRRWALKNPAISSVVAAFSKFEDVKNAVEIMSKEFDSGDAALLDQYRLAFRNTYCRYCGKCEGQCPYGVAVAEVQRYAMYFKYYGREKAAMELYAALPREVRAHPCAGCPGYCMRACPHGIDTRAQLAEAHGLLSAPPSAIA